MSERRRGVPGWVVMVPISLALHAAVLVAVASLVPPRDSLPALMIDLNAVIAEASEAGASPSSSEGDRRVPAGVGPVRAPAAARPPAAARSSAPPASPPGGQGPAVAAAPPAAPKDVERPAPAPIALPPRPSDSSTAPAAARETGASPVPVPDATPSPAGTASPSSIPAASTSDGARGVAWAPGAGGGATAGASGEGGRESHGAGGGGTGVAAGGGDRLALAVPGAGGGAGAEYTAYLGRLRERLQQMLRYPPGAQRRGISGTVQLEIAIEPDGGVSAVSVAASSTHDALDRAALDAARSLPRQPFPADVRARALKVRVPVTFKLQ